MRIIEMFVEKVALLRWPLCMVCGPCDLRGLARNQYVTS
jgi:hypothetical protein